MILLVIISAALLLDLFAGEPPNRFHPVAWLGSWISFLWKKRPGSGKSFDGQGVSSREKRKNGALFFHGILITLSGGIFIIPLVFITEKLPVIIYILLSIPLFKLSFSLRGLFYAASAVRNSLKSGDLEEARHLTSYHLVSRPTGSLDRGDIAAAVIESMAENITDSFTSPFFYYLTFGLPGAWACRYINTCDAMIGYRRDDYEWGGKFPARLDDLIHLPTGIFTALSIIIAGIKDSPLKESWRILLSEGVKTASPNAGRTMAAMAAVLNVRLEKKGCYVLNPQGRIPSWEDISRCLRICIRTVILILFLGLAAGVIVYGF